MCFALLVATCLAVVNKKFRSYSRKKKKKTVMEFGIKLGKNIYIFFNYKSNGPIFVLTIRRSLVLFGIINQCYNPTSEIILNY